MSPAETKSKIRPQQSCLKCRERKVKCDRNIPCEACIHRGIEAECTYLTSAEDRAHISQAELIDRLRREVAQLRNQLNQTSARGNSPGRRDQVYARQPQTAEVRGGSFTATRDWAPGSARFGPGSRSTTGSAEPMDGNGSLAGSSPSSISATTRTHSGTVTSPESMGSESGACGHVQQQQYAYSGSQGMYGTHVAEVDMPTVTDATALSNYLNDDPMNPYYAESMSAFAPKTPGSISLQGLPSQAMHPAPDDGHMGLPALHMYCNRDHPTYDETPAHAQVNADLANYGHGGPYIHHVYDDTYVNTLDSQGISRTYPQPWSQGQSSAQTQPQGTSHPPLPFPPDDHPPNGPTYSSSSMSIPMPTASPADLTVYPHLQSYQTTNPDQTCSPPRYPTEYQTRAINSIPDSWKGPDKRPLLETLLETITSCDEERVAQVVAVVRASQTPEDAVSGICQVLGISGSHAGPSLMR